MIYLSGKLFFVLCFFFFLYYIFPKKYRYVVLLLASLSTILMINPIKSNCLVFISVLVVYLCGIGVEKAKGCMKIVIYLIGLCFSLSCMLLLKTFSEFTNLTNYILAPLGLSYYTFALTGYLVDVKREMYSAEKNPFKFFLYGSFFPILISGPIINYSTMKEQLFEGHDFDVKKVVFGIQRIIWGLFKKIVIADRIGMVVSSIFDNYTEYHGFYILIAVILYPIQLYADFSGCIDMIKGIAELFGVDLPDNFKLPFLSESVAEIWRRWHITLGQWLKDYVFYSVLRSSVVKNVSKKLKKKYKGKSVMQVMTWFSLLITWFCVGLWHNGTWNNVFGVGIFFGSVIIISEATQKQRDQLATKLKLNTNNAIWKFFRIVRTYILFAIGNSFSRQKYGLMAGFKMWKRLFSLNNINVLLDGSLLNLGLDKVEWCIFFVALTLLIVSGLVKSRINGSIRDWVYDKGVCFSYALWLVIICACVLFGWYGEGYTSQAFIYQQF